MKTFVPPQLKPLVLATVLAFAGDATAATFTVVNTNANGTGSLVDALAQASNCAGAPHTVNFNIPGPGPFIITPFATLNMGACAATIVDGYTQPFATANTIANPSAGSDANILIEIDGSVITGGGLWVGSGASQVVRGLNLRSYVQPGTTITMNGTGVQVSGNFIGTDVGGDSCTGAGMSNGVVLNGGGLLGGGIAGDRNVIGCATGVGKGAVFPNGQATIWGNRIGVGATGGFIPNGGEAIAIGPCGGGCFSGNVIGNTLLGLGNVITHSSHGVRVGSNANVTIVGNDIFGNNLAGIDLPGPNANGAAINPPLLNAPAPAAGPADSGGVRYNAGDTIISGTFQSFANRSGITFDFFENFFGGLDQGEDYLGTVTGFSTNGSGAGTFTFNAGGIVRNPTVTFTVSTDNATSRFSAPFPTPESNATPPTFPPTTVGGTSPVSPFMIANPGNAPLRLDFSNTNSAEFKDSTMPATSAYCGIGANAGGGPNAATASIPPGGDCTMNFIFTPSGTGPRTSTFDISSNAPQNPQSFTLTGVGSAVPAPALSIAPPNLSFGTVPVGSTAGPLTLTLTNSGSAPLDFSFPFVTSNAAYTVTTTCPATLAVGLNCPADVFFTPSTIGTVPASVIISSNAPTSPNMVPVTGDGSAAAVPVANVAPTSLTFPGQTIGTTSAPQTVTLSNSGTAPLVVNGVTASGDFAQTNSCGTPPFTVAVGGNCPINVTFTPIAAGGRSGAVTIVDNASGSPRSVTLSGTGVTGSGAAITVAPTSLTFPPTQVGSGSGEQTVTITSSGTGTLTFTVIEIVGTEFRITFNDCPSSLPPGMVCTVKVISAPTVAGTRDETLRIVTNATPALVNLRGTGTATAAGTLDANPRVLTFSDQVAGTTSASKPVAISNTGTVPVSISSVSVSGDFSQTNDCSVVAPGGGCTVTVVFGPQAVGTRDGALTIVSNASNPSLSVSLQGNGVLTALPVIELSPTSIGFGNRVMGIGSGSQVVTLTNRGGANLVIQRFYTQGDFKQTNNCPTTVAPGASCRIDVGFLGSIPGPRGGRLLVESNATTVPKTVELAGTGCRFFTLPASRISTLTCF